MNRLKVLTGTVPMILKEYDFDNVNINNFLFGKRSVIIKHEYKKQILNELTRVGIDEYSIFPDASHLMSAINKEMISARIQYKDRHHAKID